ncbi:MAG TPA: cytochrome c-type biogenesis protein [Beijerinckiaceae bacterium]|jgi:cytochrome c-type biogenesis protein CcmH
MLKRLRLLLIAAALAGPLAGGYARAVEPDEVLRDPAMEARARQISAGLRCLVCQNQSIDDSDAPLARDLRLLVRERLKAGDSDRAIADFLVQRYGEFVLLKPTFGAKTALLWLTPLLVGGAGAAGILLALRRRRPAPVEGGLSPDEQAALDGLLRRDRAV